MPLDRAPYNSFNLSMPYYVKLIGSPNRGFSAELLIQLGLLLATASHRLPQRYGEGWKDRLSLTPVCVIDLSKKVCIYSCSW